MIRDRGYVGNSGLKAAASGSTVAAADTGGGGRGLSILMEPGE